jgi:hypothetical protein
LLTTRPRLPRRRSASEKQRLPGAPVVAVCRSPLGLKLRVDVTGLAHPPDRLVLATTAEGEAPVTETLVVDKLTRGRVAIRRPLDRAKAKTIDTSTISASGVPSAPPETPIRLGSAGPVSPGNRLAPVLAALDRLVVDRPASRPPRCSSAGPYRLTQSAGRQREACRAGEGARTIDNEEGVRA